MKELKFGFEPKQKPSTPATKYTRNDLKTEFIKLYDDKQKGEKDYDEFSSLSMKIFKGGPSFTFLDKGKNEQCPYLIKRDYDLQVNELFAVILYSSNGDAAKKMRQYWQSKDPVIKIPIIASLLYSATHKNYRKMKYFAQYESYGGRGITGYFGMSGIDLPIKITDGITKNVGEFLQGAILKGPWSTTKDPKVAQEIFANCDVYDTEEWVHDTAFTQKDTSIVFEVIVDAANGNTDDDLGVLPLQGLSAWGYEKEILLYNVNGKYVKILKACRKRQIPLSKIKKKPPPEPTNEFVATTAEFEEQLKDLKAVLGEQYSDDQLYGAAIETCIKQDFTDQGYPEPNIIRTVDARNQAVVYKLHWNRKEFRPAYDIYGKHKDKPFQEKGHYKLIRRGTNVKEIYYPYFLTQTIWTIGREHQVRLKTKKELQQEMKELVFKYDGWEAEEIRDDKKKMKCFKRRYVQKDEAQNEYYNRLEEIEMERLNEEKTEMIEIDRNILRSRKSHKTNRMHKNNHHYKF